MSDPTGAGARLQEAWLARQDPVEIILAKWKTLPFIRMLWGVYREARSDYLDNVDMIYAITESLPETFQKRLSKIEEKTKDLSWFRYMELPDLVDKMEAARDAAVVFKRSVWTAADRETFAGCEDVNTIYICWNNLLLDLKKEVGEEGMEDFVLDPGWKHFSMKDIRDILGLVSLLLD